MQVVTAPISRDEPRVNRASIVANLQSALLLLLRGGAIQGAKERQQFFEDGLQREQREQLYGDITLKLVTMFQEQFQQNLALFQPFFLVVSGNVDAATAEVMNRRLFEIGAFRSLDGAVKNREGSPVVGNLLFAFDKDNIGGAFLGSANTNADGAYAVFYDPSLYASPGEGVLRVKKIIDLVVQVFDAGGHTIAESQPLHDPGQKVTVDLKIGDMPASQAFILRGQVVDVNGPINGIEVSVFDRDLFFGRDVANNGQRLGTEVTTRLAPKNEDGCFEFTYQTSDFTNGDILQDGQTIPDLIFALSKDGQPQEKFQVFRVPDGNGFKEEVLVSDDDLILGIQPRQVEEVRILISDVEPNPHMSEYERLWRAIEPLLPERAPEDAGDAQREMLVCAAATRFDEEKHRDISFVARETGLDPSLIRSFASACRLAIGPFQNALAASVFYALARLRGASDLLALARLSTDDLRLALEQSAMDAPTLIPPFDRVESMDAAVQTIREALASQLPNHRAAEGEPSLADLVGVDLPDVNEQATLWRTYSDHVGTATEFWQKLQAQPGFEDPNKIARVQYSFQLGLLAQNNVSLVNAVRNLRPDVTDTSELAFLLDTPEKWTALLNEAAISIPPDVPGLPEERKANYAASLAGALQIAHPTAAVANMVASLPLTHLSGVQPAVARFLTGAVQEAKFDLATGGINDLVTQHGDKLLEGVDLKDRTVVIDQVKRVQRLFRLSSGPESMKVLLDAGIHSARDLAELPSEVAMDMLKPKLGEVATRLMLNRATNITAETIHKFILVNDQINGQIPRTLRHVEGLKEMGEVASQPGPDYASLFGSVELCDCQDCRSIHSPAAYLVDLLQFLGLGFRPENPSVTPLDVLIGNTDKGVKGRRPDIGRLQLSCENTNTTLPYVDLVNEVLESYIVFTQTLPLKTDEAGAVLVPPVAQPNESSVGVTAAELVANPENTRDRAYEELEAAVYPFTLPFNQPIAALRLTLEQMGSSLHEVMDLFRRDESEVVNRALDVEAFKLTEHEFAILTGERFNTAPAVKPVSDFYGFESPVESWIESVTHAPNFLARTGITYLELIDLLRASYINPSLPQGEALAAFERIPVSYGVLAALVASNFADPDARTLKALGDAAMTVDDLAAWAAGHFEALGKLLVLDAPDSACDLTLTRLQHLDGTALDEADLSRVHRFIRLWRKLGWTMQDLDRAHVALGAADIDPTFLRHLGRIVQLQETLKLSAQELISFWGTIPTAGDDALYQRLFLNKAVREIDAVFTSVDGKYLPASLDLKIKDHVPALLAGLRTRAADLLLIRKHTKLDDDAAPLTLSTATALYRYVTLARALKLAVKDLIELQAMSGETLFSTLPDPLGGFTEIDPARTLRFVRLMDRVKQSGFTPVSLSYLFNNLTDVRPQLAPQNESVQLLLATIREGLIRIAAENVSTDDPTGETTRARLGQLFEAHTVEQIAGLIAGTQTYTAPLAAKPAALPVGKVTYDEASRRLKTAGWLTVADQDALLALPDIGGLHAAVKSLSEQPRDLLKETLVKQLGWTTAETDLKASVLEATSLGADGTIEPALVAGKFNAFLIGAIPYLRTALGRAFVKQTLADALNLDPAAGSLLLEGAQEVAPLGTDAKKEVPAIADFLRLSGDGLKATYFENETLAEPSRESRVDPTIDFRFDARHGFSVRWQGKLLADKTQRYQFHVRAGGSVQFTVDGKPLIDRQEDVAPAEYTIAVEMEAGKLYDLELKYFNHAAPALIELRWSGPATPVEIVPSFRLYSDGDVLKAVERTYIRLHKASLLLNGFKFTQRELVYLAQPKKSDGSLAHPNAFDLNDLPVDNPATDQQALFAAWTRWNDFAALRALAMRDPTFMVDAITASTINEAQAALAQATGWDANALATLAGNEGFDLKDEAYQDTAALLKVADAMRLLGLLGAPAAEVLGWAGAAPTMEQSRISAQEAKRAHKAQYDNEAWLEIARPIANQLRESQRAALVAYLMPRLGFTDTGELFGHFLIDVEMSACMQTSRIKQAISSVQLFVQRCRMNLERSDDPNRDVNPKMIDPNRWRWMQNYRVWEANLKVFLYPENWIEPELRDDKSPFFRELESELLQGEVTTENAEIALGHYLEKLDSVSQLKICGMLEDKLPLDEPSESLLHVFGYTFTTPRTFYYRQLVTVNSSNRYWTAWEKLPLDIEADEVLPVIWNRRLYLFWQVITEKADTSAPVNADFKRSTFLIRLAWSEYRSGKWSTKNVTTSDQALQIVFYPPGSIPPQMDVEVRGDELTITFGTRFELPLDLPPGVISPTNREKSDYIRTLGKLTFRNYNGLVEPTVFKSLVVNFDNGFLATVSTALEFVPVTAPDTPFNVLSRIPQTGMRLFSPSFRPFTLDDPFFVQEGPRAYMVLPHSFESSALEGSVTNSEANPYILNYKSDKVINAVDQDLDRPLQAQLAQLTTAVNPWLASRAGIAVSEMRTLEIPASGGEAKSVAGLSLDSKLLDHGVLQPGLVGLRRELAEFRFETFFHPYAAEFQKRMNRYGVPGLLSIDSQRPADIQHPQGLPKLTSFGAAYRPSTQVRKPWPEHKVDFELAGSYSLYNWEIFFHAPLFLATRLSENQRFEEAMRWFHFIFDPTAPAAPTELAPQCYWNVLPFRNAQPLRLDDMLKAMNAGNADLIAQWQDLQAHPFQPHRVARMRLLAYQKTVVMKYIDNLIAWADQLFRQDAIESINQATQLYVMAAELLGPLPQRLPQRGRNQTRTYNELRAAGFDKFNQVMTLFENDLPFSSQATAGDSSTESAGLLGIGRTFYFGIPKNDKLLGYWDTVADRLFKIRHCMNIEGVVRELPLFEPPIDPALLVRAAAQGIDLSSVLNDLSAPLPFYRFSAILGKALELTAELRSLGAALVAALEKRDAEHLADLRATHETELLSLVKQVKEQQHEEAKTSEEGLQKSREVTQTRYDFYNNIPQRIAEEANQLFQLEEGRNFQRDGQTSENIITDLARDLPDMTTGWGYTTSGGWQQKADITWGRSNVIAHYQADSRRKSYDASIRVSWANDASILGGWQRRANDWELQKNLALKELAQIDKQIAAAHIRVAIAQQELDNTTRQIEQSQEVEEFLRTKFTGEELYSWMQGEISTIYFQCYQMTYDLAKKAERCFRFERGLASSNFIQFGAWDSLRKGLLSGERLYLQLKQMERAYLDGNRREYELTKHYSLALNDPEALINLKGLGQCEIELPEALFDSDYPGHYMRRVKSVSLTIPAVVGPYTSLNCTLTLLRDKTRVKATPADGYAERDGEEDDRFMTNWAPLQSIATSTGQNDGGLFELNFRDERYLPFEGAGTISRWRITLDPDANGFDFNTLSDVVLHLRYTARDGGERLKKGAQASLAQAIGEEATKPLARLFSLKHEFPTEWHRFTQPVAPAVGTFTIDKERFPFLFRGKSKTITVRKVHVYAVLKHGAEPALPLSVVLTPPGGKDNRIEFEPGNKKWRKIQAPKNTPDVNTEIMAIPADSQWALKAGSGDLANNVDDLLLMCEYTVELNR